MVIVKQDTKHYIEHSGKTEFLLLPGMDHNTKTKLNSTIYTTDINTN